MIPTTTNYTAHRLELLNISAALNNISDSQKAFFPTNNSFTNFNPIDNGQSMGISYIDHNGNSITFNQDQKRDSKYLEFYKGNQFDELLPGELDQAFIRKRLHPQAIINNMVNGFGNRKYTQAKGSGLHAYFTALYQCFINPDTKIYESDFKEIVIVEGELKAWSLCLAGIPAIGISGIQGATIQLNKEGTSKKECQETNKMFVWDSSMFIPEIQNFINDYRPEHIIQLQDADALDNIHKPKRQKNFFVSVKYFNNACSHQNIKHTYIHLNDIQYKGIDDLLLSPTIEKENILTQLTGQSNKDIVVNEFMTIYNVDAPYMLNRLKGVFEHSAIKFLTVPVYLFTALQLLELAILEENQKKIQQILGVFAPTGVGKTDTFYYMMLERIKKKFPQKRIFFVYPSNVANAAKTNEYSDSSLNHHQLHLNILSIDQYTSFEQKEQIGNIIDDYDCINFVPNSWRWVQQYVRKGDFIIYDEIHKPILQSKIAPTKDIEEILNSPATKIVLTGTPLESFNKSYNVKPIYVKRSNSPTFHLNLIELGWNNNQKQRLEKIKNKKPKKEHTKQQQQENIHFLENGGQSFSIKGENQLFRIAVRNLIDNIPTQDKKLYFFYINDKNAIDAHVQYCQQLGIDTDVIYSKKNNNGAAWKCLTQGKPIPLNDGKPMIVFLTCLGYESLNLKNKKEEIGYFAVFGEKFVHNTIQAKGRARLIDELDIYYYLAKQDKRKGFSKSFEQFHKECLGSYEAYQFLQKHLLGNNDPLQIIDHTNRKRILNRISQITNENGELSELAIVTAYEELKAQTETNQQKFGRLVSNFEKWGENIDVKNRNLDVNDVGQLFTNDVTSNTKNELIVINEIQNETAAHKSATAAVNQMISENIYFTLALRTDNNIFERLKVDTRKEINDILTAPQIHDSNEYLIFKEKYAGYFNNRQFRKELVKRTKRIIELCGSGGRYHITSIIDIVINSRYNTIKQELDTALLLDGDRQYQTDKIDGAMYDFILQKFEIGKRYTIPDIVEMCQKEYQYFKHRLFSDRDFTKQIRRMFKTKTVKCVDGVLCKGILIIEKNTHEKVMDRYGLSPKIRLN